MPLFFSSQKHRGHSRKRLSADGDSLILFFFGIPVFGAGSSMKSHRVLCFPSLIYCTFLERFQKETFSAISCQTFDIVSITIDIEEKTVILVRILSASM